MIEAADALEAAVHGSEDDVRAVADEITQSPPAWPGPERLAVLQALRDRILTLQAEGRAWGDVHECATYAVARGLGPDATSDILQNLTPALVAGGDIRDGYRFMAWPGLLLVLKSGILGCRDPVEVLERLAPHCGAEPGTTAPNFVVAWLSEDQPASSRSRVRLVRNALERGEELPDDLETLDARRLRSKAHVIAAAVASALRSEALASVLPNVLGYGAEYHGSSAVSALARVGVDPVPIVDGLLRIGEEALAALLSIMAGSTPPPASGLSTEELTWALTELSELVEPHRFPTPEIRDAILAWLNTTLHPGLPTWESVEVELTIRYRLGGPVPSTAEVADRFVGRAVDCTVVPFRMLFHAVDDGAAPQLSDHPRADWYGVALDALTFAPPRPRTSSGYVTGLPLFVRIVSHRAWQADERILDALARLHVEQVTSIHWVEGEIPPHIALAWFETLLRSTLDRWTNDYVPRGLLETLLELERREGPGSGRRPSERISGAMVASAPPPMRDLVHRLLLRAPEASTQGEATR